MTEKNIDLNKLVAKIGRAILAGVFLLTTVASAMPTRSANADGLALDHTSGLLAGDGRVALAPTIEEIDIFPGAEIPSLPYQHLNVDISGATEEDLTDPGPIIMGDCDSNQGEYTVWYNFNPGPQNAYISLDTRNSDYDTVLAVWKGGPGSLTLVACHDDISLDDITSELKLFVDANTTYYFEVIKFAAPGTQTGGLEAAATGNTLNFHVSKINYLMDPPSLNFGNQLYRNMTAVKTVTYTNFNGSPVQIGTLSITDSYLSKQTMFLQNNTCNNVILADGDSCTFGVSFQPWIAGPVTGKVTIPSNAPDQPHYLNLAGKGVLGTALLKNPSFENDKNKDRVPDSWAGRNLTRNVDVRTSRYKYHRLYSMKLVGQKPKKVKILTQVIYKNGAKGDDFYLEAWSRSVKSPAQGARIFVYWYNGTKLVGSTSMVWGKGTYKFKPLWKAYTAPARYTRILVKISYTQTSGTVWIDKFIFKWAPSPP